MSSSEWTYLTTDHLGTPLLATSDGGAELWRGPLEPFGADALRDGPEGALEAGLRLRLPGQWEDEVWQSATLGADVYYNVHRWYDMGTGRYGRVDPLGTVDGGLLPAAGEEMPRSWYAYAESQPTALVDAEGLRAQVCCKQLLANEGLLLRTLGRAFRHCYIRVESDSGRIRTWGLHHRSGGIVGFGRGRVFPDANYDLEGPRGECGDWNEGCEVDRCVDRAANNYPGKRRNSTYNFLGPNSNTFAGRVTDQCALDAPSIAGTARTPGWGFPVLPSEW